MEVKAYLNLMFFLKQSLHDDKATIKLVLSFKKILTNLFSNFFPTKRSLHIKNNKTAFFCKMLKLAIFDY